MKRPKLKKASKRVSCAKRYKIQKKVREHNRKLRKEAKKKGVSKRVKKDPGVPSSAPFKEEVLREAEQRRQQIEEEKEKKRQAKIQERAQKRKKDGDDAKKESEPSAKKARKNKAAKNSENGVLDKSSKPYLCQEFNKVITASDVVIEVLDARDPLGCRCPEVEKAVLQSDGKKKLIFLLNKIDLVPKEIVEGWVKRLQLECPIVAFKASTQINEKKVQTKRRRIVPSNEILERSRGSVCFGNSCLTELLTRFATHLPDDSTLRVGLVGFPNVGKSSIINSLKGVLACNAGMKRGTTKSMQELNITKNLKLIDSPGVLASPSNPAASMALRSLQVEEGSESVQEAAGNLLQQYDKTQIMLHYKIPDYRDSVEFFTLLAKKRGYLQKGGVPDLEQAATVFLTDCTGAKMSYHCKPQEPPSLPAYMSDDVVAEMKSGWDLNHLKTSNEETLRVLRFPTQANSISFISNGPTEGLLSVSNISEDQPVIAATTEEKEKQNNEPEQTSENENETSESSHQVSHGKKPALVHFQSAPNPTNLPSASADDAYDFNTDFK